MNDNPSSPAPLPDRTLWIQLAGLLALAQGAIFLWTALPEPFPSSWDDAPAFAAQFAAALAIAGFWLVVGWGSLRLRRWAGRLLPAIFAVLGLHWAAVVAVLLAFWIIARINVAGMLELFLVAVENPGPVLAIALLVLLSPVFASWFYSRPSVRRTFEDRDPAPSWTDSRSRTLLCVSAIFVTQAAWYLWEAYEGKVLAFGVYWNGVYARVACAVLAVLGLWIAWRLCTFDRAAWWAALAWTGTASASFVFTLLRTNPLSLAPDTGHLGEQALAWLFLAILLTVQAIPVLVLFAVLSIHREFV